MKAVVMDRYGTPDVLELRDVAKPTPKADQVLVRVLAASVNDWDWGLLRGAPVNRMLTVSSRRGCISLAVISLGVLKPWAEMSQRSSRVMRSTAICA